MGLISTLKWQDFTKMSSERKRIIKKTDDGEIPSLSSYKANQLSAALHPKKQLLEITRFEQLSQNTKRFTFVNAERGKSVAFFSAGQYIVVTVKIGDNVYKRPYSLSSSPLDAFNGSYQITVQKTEPSLVSAYILENWKVGTKVEASAPCGTFEYEPLRDAKNVIGVAGGSGITPFRSLAESVVDGDDDIESLTILYGSKTLADALFMDEFKELMNKSSKIKVINVLSNEIKDGCENGFISADIIKKYAPKNKPYSLFIVGPSAMYTYIKGELSKLNLRKKFIRFDASESRLDLDKVNGYVKPQNDKFSITVHVRDEIKTAIIDRDKTILASMEENGIIAPSACRGGKCAVCRSRLIKGDVFVDEAKDGRRAADKKFGFIHPCCTYPLSNLELELPPSN